MLSGTRQTIWEHDALTTHSTLGRIIILDEVYLQLDIGERVLLTPNDEIKVIVGNSYDYHAITYEDILSVFSCDDNCLLYAGKNAMVRKDVYKQKRL